VVVKCGRVNTTWGIILLYSDVILPITSQTFCIKFSSHFWLSQMYTAVQSIVVKLILRKTHVSAAGVFWVLYHCYISVFYIVVALFVHCCCYQNSFSCFKRSSSEVAIYGISKVDIKAELKWGQMGFMPRAYTFKNPIHIFFLIFNLLYF